MSLTLNKPLCFFDLETTGVNIAKDRIVEISILKVNQNGEEKQKTWRVNPEMPIPPAVTAIHGITNEDVANEPNFKTIAPQIIELIKDSDLAGFNSNRFDVPLLAEEFLRCGYDFDLKKHNLVDVQVIYHKMEPRNLSAAYKYYCQKELDGAHSAQADTRATYEVMLAQIEKYNDLPGDVKGLSEFTSSNPFADLAGFIGYDASGEECFNFGKHKGKKVSEVLEQDKGYFGWLQNADFPLYTKKVLTAVQLRMKDPS